MPNVVVTNTNDKSISVLGLGPVAPNTTKSGYLEEAVFAPHAVAYRTRTANIGLVVQEVGMAVPTGVQEITSAATVADATKVALVTALSADYAVALPSAADVAEGSTLNLRFNAGDYAVALTPASDETAGDAAVTYDLDATAADATGTGFVITTTHTITRNDAGSWITEGYLEGGRIVIQDAEDAGNDGTHVIATVAASVITVESVLTNNANDTVVHFGVDNRIRLDEDNDIVRLVSDGVSAWALA